MESLGVKTIKTNNPFAGKWVIVAVTEILGTD
jgi:hypothetical protein